MHTEKVVQDKRIVATAEKKEDKQIAAARIKGALDSFPKQGCRDFPPDFYPRK